MGWTNSVQCFCRIVNEVFKEHIKKKAISFLDDFGIKGPTSRYGDHEVALGVRQFVLKHLQNLNAILANLERARCTIRPKSQFCVNGINAVGFVCDEDGRHPASDKIIKILKWTRCNNITEARAFIGICVYFRVFIKDFTLITNPIYQLFRKEIPFE